MAAGGGDGDGDGGERATEGDCPLVELRRPKAAFIRPRRGRALPPSPPRGSRGSLAAAPIKLPALFTMLIGAHVKHKFMLKAEMLSSSRMRYGADRSCLPVPGRSGIGPEVFREIMPISIFDVLSAASSCRSSHRGCAVSPLSLSLSVRLCLCLSFVLFSQTPPAPLPLPHLLRLLTWHANLTIMPSRSRDPLAPGSRIPRAKPEREKVGRGCACVIRKFQNQWLEREEKMKSVHLHLSSLDRRFQRSAPYVSSSST